VAVHVRAMKIYVAGVEVLRKKERGVKTGMKLVYHKKLMVFF
jgi:hypothetical protein